MPWQCWLPVKVMQKTPPEYKSGQNLQSQPAGERVVSGTQQAAGDEIGLTPMCESKLKCKPSDTAAVYCMRQVLDFRVTCSKSVYLWRPIAAV